ncbi:MAG: arginase [Nitrososphaerota archaeon]|jgi:arginase|nr:arginase [Nitrososphaerota archaeon]
MAETEAGGLNIGIIGAPVDLGQQRRGVDMGPSAIRIANLEARLEALGHVVKDYGNVPVADMATARVGDQRERYLTDVLKQCGTLADKVSTCLKQGSLPLVLGGDQSVSVGTLAGLARTSAARGIVWLDAHGDFNTPKTTPSGNIHGMALAAILGYGDPRLTGLGGVSPKAVEKNTVLVGCRDFDREEAKAIARSKMTVFTMKEIDELGMRSVMRDAIRIAGTGVDQVHLSFDVDSVDPREAPGTGTQVRGGLTYREAQLAMEMLFESGQVTSAEFVEVNPILDVANQTAELVVELALSLFGKKIIG